MEYYGPCAGYFLFITIFKTSLASQKNQDSFAEKLRLQDVENRSETEPARCTELKPIVLERAFTTQAHPKPLAKLYKRGAYNLDFTDCKPF